MPRRSSNLSVVTIWCNGWPVAQIDPNDFHPQRIGREVAEFARDYVRGTLPPMPKDAIEQLFGDPPAEARALRVEEPA